MNQYSIVVLGDISDATVGDMKRIAAILGYCAVMGAEFEVNLTSGMVGAEAVFGQSIRATAPLRLPSYISLGATYEAIFEDAKGSVHAQLTAADQQASAQLANLERAIVNQGDFIAAIVDEGTSIDSQLLNSTIIAFGGKTRLVLGTASQSAQQGVYETPFSEARAYVNFGSLANVAGLVTNAAPLPVEQFTAIPVNG